jgi:hypothetical protein
MALSTYRLMYNINKNTSIFNYFNDFFLRKPIKKKEVRFTETPIIHEFNFYEGEDRGVVYPSVLSETDICELKDLRYYMNISNTKQMWLDKNGWHWHWISNKLY